MKSRLYFILPHLGSAHKVAEDLLLSLVENRHMHFLAKRGTRLGGLHEAGRGYKTDQWRAARNGMVLVSAIGAAIGLGMYYFQPFGVPISKFIILGMAVFGAVFGAWAGSLVGASAPNAQLRSFEPDIEAGRILLMVEVPRERADDIRDMMQHKHPEAVARGFDPMVPAFP